jgi:hypothetical protein
VPTSGFVSSDVVYRAVIGSDDHNVLIRFIASPRDSEQPHNDDNVVTSLQFALQVPPHDITRGTHLRINLALLPGLSTAGASAWARSEIDENTITVSVGGLSIDSNHYLYAVMASNNASDSRVLVEQEANDVSDVDTMGESFASLEARVSSSDLEALSCGLKKGENALYMEIRNGLLSAWLNDVLLFSDEVMYTTTAGRFGLSSHEDALVDFISGKGNNNISQIKVWSVDVPEPPDDESGHGTYSGETGFRYTDKYHESDGAGGFTYDPDA